MAGNMGDNESVMALAGFLSVDIIAELPSDNIFIKKCRGGVMGSPMSTRKWGENGQKFIFLANDGKWLENGVETTWKAFSMHISLQKHPVITFLLKNAEEGSRHRP